MNQVIDRLNWQSILFSQAVPKRVELASLSASWDCYPQQIRIHRNHSFEHVASIIQPYFAYDGWHGDFIYSEYDDSLSWGGIDAQQPADLEIVWLDFDRYSSFADQNELFEWFGKRLEALRSLTTNPILVANWISEQQDTAEFNQRLINLINELPGMGVYDRSLVWQELAGKYFDRRAANLTGTNLSDRACILHGRELACRWLPALLQPRIKGILVDLDHTLYAGVLGEDGVAGLILTDAHRALQLELFRLQQTGIFLAIVSRNEWPDVEQLFQQRPDFPLQLEHFSAFAVNWQDKAENVQTITNHLRVSADSLLFIDDNLGELVAVAQQHPHIKSILAINTRDALQALIWCPGIWTNSLTSTDSLRVADLKMSTIRELALSQATNFREYLQSLNVHLVFCVNPLDQLQRLVDLSQKTNQFNLNLQRLNVVELESAIQSEDYCVVSIALEDRLSDSGIIGLVVGNYKEGQLWIKEVCISCRALGRKLEDIMLVQSIQLILGSQVNLAVAAYYQKAERNSPALKWLEENSNDSLTCHSGSVIIRNESIHVDLSHYPIQITIQDAKKAGAACLK
jgi:FkbH-like protein